jgi:hypothetical protein
MRGLGSKFAWLVVIYFSLLGCNSKNTMSGSLGQSSSSSAASLSACSFNGQAISSGGSVTAYLSSNIPFGQTCTSQSRACNSGVLSGTYNFPSCTVSAAASCSFNGQMVASGGTVTGYTTSSVPAGQTCTTETVTCTNGLLSPNNAFATCTVSSNPSPTPTPSPCSFNGQTVSSGGTTTGYTASSVPYGQTCSSETVTCTNGVLSPSNASATCTVAPPASCTFNGQTVASGSSLTGYTTANVPNGQTCTSENVKCTNGVLSPSNAFASCTVLAPTPTPAPTPGTSSWKTLKVGAGGFIRGIDIAADGTMVNRTDTYGAYIFNGGSGVWQQLINSTSMPTSFVFPGEATGVYEIRIAPSNTNIFYLSFVGYVFVSSNRGTTWTQTGFASVGSGDMNPNDNYAQYGQKMAIDPVNSNVVYAGTEQKGLFVTTNGGNTWTAVSAVPVSTTAGITGITFDPTSGTTSGMTNIIYAGSYGNGVYISSNAGASWARLSGGPTTVVNSAMSSTGIYYATDGTSLWSYKSGAWTQLINNGGNGLQAVAVNPSNANAIAIITPGGNLNVSYNAGQTWSGINWGNTVSSPDIPWIAHGNSENGASSYLDIGNMIFSSTNPNELIASAGTGVWNTPMPSATASTVPWTDQSAGIEQLVANQILVPPGGQPVLASWDRPFFYISSLASYPATYGPIASDNIVAGWSIDYASSSPKFLVGIAEWWGTENSGYSTNGGASWTQFASFPPGASSSYMGGTIAASSPSNIIWAPADNQQPYYTTNGGTSWNAITLPGVTSWSGFDFAYYLKTRTVTADRVSANTFYLFFPGQGLFTTTNGGAAWTKTFSGDITPFDGYNSELMTVPGEASNLFFTGGVQGTLSLTAASEAFMRSTNGGTTWTAVPNVQDVLCFGFGAPQISGGYPAIYIAGWVNNVYGIWQSNDNAQTWKQLGQYPLGSLDEVVTISGDPNTYGIVYVGFGGSGYKYYGP